MPIIGKQFPVAALTASDIADGVVSTAKIADNAVTADKTSYKDVPFRNIIINGDMSQAQRGTSASNVSTGYDTVDRFKILRGAGTLDVSQESAAPTGSGFAKSFKVLENSSGASPGAGDTNRIQQIFEGQNLQYLKKGTASAESLTLSFWIKATVTGTYIAELYDLDNNRQISKTYTVSSSETWEQKEITFAGDTTDTFGNDTGGSMSLSLYLTAGSNYTSGTLNTSWAAVTTANRAVGQTNALASASDYVQITGIQLEVGTAASDFEFLPVDVNLQRCKRYFQNLAPTGLDNIRMGIGENKNTTVSGVYIKFEPEMRATPSLSSTAANTFSLYHSATDTVASGINFDSKSSKGGNIDVTVSSGLLDGGASQFLTASTSTRLDFSSEL